MSWSTNGFAPRGAAAEPPDSPFVRSARVRPARGPWAPPAWPLLVEDAPTGDAAGGARMPSRPDTLQVPPLVFGEADIARVAAAAADRAARRTRAELERGLEAKRAEALDRAASSLAGILASRRREAAGARDQVVALAAVIAGTVATDRRDVAEAVGAALDALPGAPKVRVSVDDFAAAPLRASLPGIAARAGFAGGVEIVADPRLTSGAVGVVGAGGWLEHDPARVRERVAAALAAHRPTGTTADEPSTEPTHARPENGDAHDHR
jgi:hypothetical protein